MCLRETVTNAIRSAVAHKVNSQYVWLPTKRDILYLTSIFVIIYGSEQKTITARVSSKSIKQLNRQGALLKLTTATRVLCDGLENALQRTECVMSHAWRVRTKRMRKQLNFAKKQHNQHRSCRDIERVFHTIHNTLQ